MNNDSTAEPLPPAGAVALSHWGLIRARGADARQFLHGQLTNDVLNLPPGRACLAGYCSPKGRLLASFVVWPEASGDVMLACHRTVLAATLKRLSMFVMRAQCKLSDATAEHPLWGHVGATAAALVDGLSEWDTREQPAGAGLALRLPDVDGQRRALWAAPGAEAVPPPAPALALEAWLALEVASGLPTIEASTADQFVPQMLNMELTGSVNFQKGCYPGQEVVARSQYRGTAKRRMFLFEAAAPSTSGTEVFHSGDPGQPAGMVVNSAPLGHAPGAPSRLLAEVKLAALGDGQLHLGSIDGPVLVRRALPYAVPVDSGAA